MARAVAEGARRGWERRDSSHRVDGTKAVV